MVNVLAALLTSAALASASCSRGRGGAPVRPRVAVDPKTCRTEADVAAGVGRVCTVMGTYLLKTFPAKGGASLGEWPIVKLADGGEVMIESIWDVSKKPDEKQVKHFENEQVEVVGKLHPFPPRESPENFFFHTVSPVERIQVVSR